MTMPLSAVLGTALVNFPIGARNRDGRWLEATDARGVGSEETLVLALSVTEAVVVVVVVVDATAVSFRGHGVV